MIFLQWTMVPRLDLFHFFDVKSYGLLARTKEFRVGRLCACPPWHKSITIIHRWVCCSPCRIRCKHSEHSHISKSLLWLQQIVGTKREVPQARFEQRMWNGQKVVTLFGSVRCLGLFAGIVVVVPDLCKYACSFREAVASVVGAQFRH